MVATANLKAEVAVVVLVVVERLEAAAAVEWSGVAVAVERLEVVGAEKLEVAVAEDGKVVVAKLEASNEEGAPSEKVVAGILDAKETGGEVPNQEGGVYLLGAAAAAAVVRPREGVEAAADSQMGVVEAAVYRMVVGEGGEGVCQMEVEEAEALRAEEVGARDSSGKMRQAWYREE
jgi:hypothetical protein